MACSHYQFVLAQRWLSSKRTMILGYPGLNVFSLQHLNFHSELSLVHERMITPRFAGQTANGLDRTELMIAIRSNVRICFAQGMFLYLKISIFRPISFVARTDRECELSRLPTCYSGIFKEANVHVHLKQNNPLLPSWLHLCRQTQSPLRDESRIKYSTSPRDVKRPQQPSVKKLSQLIWVNNSPVPEGQHMSAG